MRLFEFYTKWSIRRQLQTHFFTCYLFLIILYFVMTVLQLDWLQSYINENSYSVLQDNILDQMKEVNEIQGAFSANLFEGLLALVSIRKKLAENVLGFSGSNSFYFPPGPENDSKYVTTDLKNFSYVYYSRNSELSDEGRRIVRNISSLNPLLKGFFTTGVYGIYEGFYTDQLFMISPVVNLANLDFTPLVREWFYTAAREKENIVITEPYYDFGSGDLIFTASTSIMNGSEVYGVTAVDVFLRDFSSAVTDIEISDFGMIFLISSGGIITNPLSEWGVTSTKIYNNSLTGITSEKWEIIKSYPSDYPFDLTFSSFGDCIGLIYPVKRPDISKSVFYILTVVQKSMIRQPINNLSSSFEDVYWILFWCILVLSVICLIISLYVIYSIAQKVTLNITQVTDVFKTIINRACFPNITKKCSFSLIEKRSEGFQDFTKSCKERISKIEYKENEYKYVKWDGNRPSNFFVYSEWRKKLYPFNRFHEGENWEEAIKEIEKNLEN